MNIKTKLDLSYLETMSAGDADVFKELLEMLQTMLKNDLPKARKLYAAQKWTELERFCHHFKSTLSYSGDGPMIQANLALWDITTQPDKSQAVAQIEILETRGKTVLQEVTRLLKLL